ncbi:hypothetical protein [Frateuria sp. Soil773]|uniref:hypothetical protein n=1 Tax=Frateuria sp. Soil773 TaxID=1736407 RepID=UPI0012F9C77C|nr:hypothetical protein [Frateuria sp. Soil773]
MALNGFFGGDNEDTFNKTYDKGLSLPVSEEWFLDFLKSRGLSYEIYAEKKSGKGFLPTPNIGGAVDLSEIIRVYDVFDPSRLTRKVSYHYFAYVDKRHDVVYVENRFQYAGP